MGRYRTNISGGLALAQAALIFVLTPGAAAQSVGTDFSFQGQVKQDGKSINDQCDFSVTLWDAVTNGSMIGSNGFNAMDVVDGLFNLTLNYGGAAFAGDARWLEVAVACPTGESFVTMGPRHPVLAAPYALHALNGGGGGGAGDGHSLDAADGAPVDALFVDNDGDVGIGTTSPQFDLDVFASVQDRARIGQLELGGWPLNPSSFCYLGNQSLDQTVNGNYALLQGETGTTILNSAPGQNLFLLIGNAPHTVLTADGNTGIGTISPTARLEVANGGAENVARFRNGSFDISNPTTALAKVSVTGSAQLALNPPVQSNLTFEAESTTGAGLNVVRIRAEDTPLEIISADRLDVVTDGPFVIDLGGFSTFSITESTVPNIITGSATNNISAGLGSTISGGGFAASGFDPAGAHLITDHNCTIGGGASNQAGNDNGDTSDARNATIAGGVGNTASGRGSSIGGGRFNDATGLFSTVPGGFNSEANATCSFAAGCQARANHHGSYVWADAFPTNTGPAFPSTLDNQFSVRANGGVRFASTTHGTSGAILAGVQLAPGASAWSVLSDRNSKENFRHVDGKEIARILSEIPIESWNYKTQDDDIRHIGPMAQDFYGAFGLGEDEKRISTLDADGVALAAIQGLHAMIKEKDAEIAQLNQRLTRLESMIMTSAGTKTGAAQ